ncbi:hypothetical protein [Clostridium isatidis]|nr:hypothetical protein [Clostridium isatidis]
MNVNLVGSSELEIFRDIIEYIIFVIKNNKFLSGKEEIIEDKLKIILILIML